MIIIKNPIEQNSGFIECLADVGGEFVPYLLDPAMEYELSEESDWSEIKPCDPAEKAAHELQQTKDAAVQAVQSLVDGEAKARG